MSGTLIAAVLTTIVGPILGFAITQFVRKMTADVAAKQVEKQEQEIATAASVAMTKDESSLNRSIDLKQKAMEEFLNKK